MWASPILRMEWLVTAVVFGTEASSLLSLLFYSHLVLKIWWCVMCMVVAVCV